MLALQGKLHARLTRGPILLAQRPAAAVHLGFLTHSSGAGHPTAAPRQMLEIAGVALLRASPASARLPSIPPLVPVYDRAEEANQVMMFNLGVALKLLRPAVGVGVQEPLRFLRSATGGGGQVLEKAQVRGGVALQPQPPGALPKFVRRRLAPGCPVDLQAPDRGLAGAGEMPLASSRHLAASPACSSLMIVLGR